MKENRKKIISLGLFSILLITAGGGLVGYKMYTKPHRNVEAAKAIPVSGEALAGAYENNEADANTKYLDKVLEVEAVVNGVSTNQNGEPVITLKGTDMSGLICTLEGRAATAIKPNSRVTIKGICTGFLTDVVLVRCVIQSN